MTNHSIRAATRAAREIPLYAGVDSRAPSVVDLLPDGDPGPQESAEREELRSEAWDALSQLPPSQRAAVVMRYYLGYSESQIANELACASGTVKWRLHAARAHLQSLLRPVLG